MASSRGSYYFKKLEEQLTCSVCLELYTNPRILPCHHSFCLKCLEGVPLCPKPENNYYLHCPICRCITEIPGTVGVSDLPLAFELNNFRDIYDKMKLSEHSSQSKSSQVASTVSASGHDSTVTTTVVPCHHSDKKQIFCETCNTLICINCTSESHKSHSWNSLEESYRRYCQNMSSEIAPLREKITALQDASTLLENVEKEISKQGEDIKQSMKIAANEMIKAIRESESQLTNEVEATMMNKLLVVSSQKMSVDASLGQLKKFDEYFMDAIKGDKPQLALLAKQNMMKRMTEALENVRMEEFNPMDRADMKFVQGSANISVGNLECSLLAIQEFKIEASGIKLEGRNFVFSLSIILPNSSVRLSLPIEYLSCTLVPVFSGPPIFTTVSTTPLPGLYQVKLSCTGSHCCTVEVEVHGVKIKDKPQIMVPSIPLKAIGIDLGTAYSCVGIFHDGKVEIVPNEQGNRITSSFVAFTDVERLIGDSAKNQASMNPLNTVFDAKKLLGKRIDESSIVSHNKYWPFKLLEGMNGRPLIEVEYKGEVKMFCAEEILAMTLGKMKEMFETYFHLPAVVDAVITIPASFNSLQRQATRDAAAIAGLNVIRMVIEPVAAALAYGYYKRISEIRNVLVFDLGAGFLNVAVVIIEEEICEVKSVCSNSNVGGNEFNKRLVDYCSMQFRRKYKKNLFESKRSVVRLMVACERAKRMLSSESRASIELDSLFEGIDYYTTITRSKFEEINADLFSVTLEFIEKALRDAKISKDEIHDILLIGGSTRIPYVQKLLQDFFNGKKLNKSVNPDEIVACGAALQAAILSGDESETLQDTFLLNVIPFSFGVETAGGVFMAMIKRNSTFPAKVQETFTTYYDNQTNIVIKVYEGERAMTKDNSLLGKFLVSGIPKAPRGCPKITITFSINSNQIIEMFVTYEGLTTPGAVSASAGIEGLCELDEPLTFPSGYIDGSNVIKFHFTPPSSALTVDDMEHMVANANLFRADDNQQRQRIAAKNHLESYAFDVKDKLRVKRNLTEQQLRVIDKCDQVIKWLDENQYADKVEFDYQINELEKVCSPVIASYSKSDAASTSK
ncbi:PREDICTED: heat shock cognate 71 kDa protein-like [Amphimedon queenslandica]|uniref:RING-type domain-containing protein n=3 Tax=Amphimedon queenslandica TaxID=400682 RepID=A0AAN0JAH8_AMPQE|nr:PREDICTED: heat shock cognate 71 kDa protein-like [Amphimedon queenslandica]|eukprot:XP_019853974.1 PREDICTED: heat shock cognate 71 kDa protein-like [Amphimedon queenslandica]